MKYKDEAMDYKQLVQVLSDMPLTRISAVTAILQLCLSGFTLIDFSFHVLFSPNVVHVMLPKRTVSFKFRHYI